jgi:hypothetical protein
VAPSEKKPVKGGGQQQRVVSGRGSKPSGIESKDIQIRTTGSHLSQQLGLLSLKIDSFGAEQTNRVLAQHPTRIHNRSTLGRAQV